MNDEPSQNLDPVPASEPASASATNVTNAADIKLEQQIVNENATYAEKTDRLKALTKFLKTVTPLIWVGVFCLVIIPLVGNWIISQSVTSNRSVSCSTSKLH